MIESDKKGLKQLGIVAIIVIGIPTLVIGSCVHSCKKEWDRVQAQPKKTESERLRDEIKTDLKNTQFEPGTQKYVDEILKDE